MPKIALDIPKALLPLLQPARYKVMYGGRGAGKSFTVASWLVVLGLQRPLRVLCAREYQVSIKDSVHRLLADRIDALGLSAFYNVTQTSITSTNGTEFTFKGLHHNAQEIKSFEGADLCWIEEAQAVSAESWDVLIPTIRKQGSEIWLTFNPLSPDDATWQRFVKNPPPGAWVQKVLFSDNPWFPEVLDDERKHLQEIDPELYQHVWLGEPRTISDAQVFKGRYLVQEFDTPEDARFFHGADWGFSVDPSVLIRCFIRGNVLYVDREAYGAGVELDETPQLFDSIETSRKWAIKADSARPETISYMKRQGFKIEAAKKWAGSVEDGLAILKSFDKIIIHPRCVHAADEFYKYSYKVDKNNGDVLPIVVDANNHCIAEGSLIATERGNVPIEDVTIADRVLTREGYKRVLWAGKTGENRDVMKITAGDYSLVCTPGHLIYTINRGFVQAATVTGEDVLLCLEKQQNSTASHGTDTRTRGAEVTAFISSAQSVKTGKFTRNGYTATFTKKRMAKSRKVFTSITRTGTLTTTRLKIWSAFQPQITDTNTRLTLNNWKSKKNFLNESDRLQRLGIKARKGVQSIEKSAGFRIRISSQNRSNARIAAKRFCRENSAIKTDFVLTPVNQHGGENSISTMKKGLARFAASPFLSTNTAIKKLVPVRVRGVCVLKDGATVYDLAIENQHEFFAECVLVHNCIDALRYALDGYIHRGGGMKINLANLRGR